MKNKSLKLLSVLLVLSLLMVGCGQATKDVNQNEAADQMQYIGPEALKTDIESGSNEYVILDVRKAEDFNTSHIKGSYEADVDAANKGGDDEAGKVSLKKALQEATGSETGNADDKYALVCYSGKSYAEKATELMMDMGISKDQIYTVEGGMKAWEEGGDDYKGLLGN